MTGAVASSLSVLGPEWFSAALGTPVSAARAERLAFSGATTDLARVTLSYAADHDGPATVIAKIIGRDEVRAAMDAAMGLFAREAQFYRQFAGRVPVRTPACLHVGDGHETPLLLEDLAGLRAGDQMCGLELEDAERIIDALAALHARFWQTSETGEPWLLDPAGDAYAEMVAQLVASGAPRLRELFDGRISPRTLDLVLEHSAGWQHVLRLGVEGPRTIAHHDCRLDNIFFADDNTPVFIDWQATASARGTQDVANLLAQSMDPETLNAHWTALLRRYHDGLVAGGVSDYPFDDCQTHYRQNVLYAVASGLALIGAMDIGDGRGLGEAILFRALAHVDEIDAFGAL